MAYRVHGECDRTVTYSELVNAVGRKYGLNLSWDEMKPVVEELRSRNILLKLNRAEKAENLVYSGGRFYKKAYVKRKLGTIPSKNN